MAILNERDFRVARARLARLQRWSAEASLSEEIANHLPPGAAEARRATLLAEKERLEAELTRYQQLRAARPEEAELSASELGLLPILARIARNLSQRELAERVGVKEQQIQRYERERYRAISLERYEQVLSALDVEIQPRLRDKAPRANRHIEIDLELDPILLRELRKRNWVDLPRSSSTADMKATLADYIEQTSSLAKTATLNRQTRSAKAPNGVISLWTARVLEKAASQKSNLKGKFNVADTSWLGKLVSLSMYPDGPLRAVSLLREHGVILVIEPHLPRTHLDGAALMLADSIPVIALTLRHDRIDNFWFTLLHELGHVYLHFNNGLSEGFIDDDLDESRTNDLERQADDFARTRLIPDELWRVAPVRFTRSKDAVERFAVKYNVHPAIVAGRIRSERDFSIFADLVGSGQVRKLFAAGSS